MRIHYFILLLTLSVLVACTTSESGDLISVNVRTEVSDAPVQHALGVWRKLAEAGIVSWDAETPQWRIQARIDAEVGAEAYRIEISGQDVLVKGGDAVGAMYGLLDLKDQLLQAKAFTDRSVAPRFPFRAIKFNLPWDSYRNGPALQLHEETCRDTLFWEAFLDMMADNRFNKLTLWNLHPFNYLVRTEKYPEACGFSDAELADWQAFWRSLFRMAEDRGIETYLINWNIFVSPEFAEAHDVAEYCLQHEYITDRGDTSEIIKDYTREAVKAVIDAYPKLTGLGITLGEGMGGMTAPEREQWLLDSYVAGMRMASRPVKFIHRVPLSAGRGSGGSTDPVVERMTRETLDTLSCVDGPINIELKFNWSHAYSSTDLVKVHGGKLTDAYWNPTPENYRLAWMMRNEDFFVLRWGQPDFIREHMRKNGFAGVNGYFVGSECYIPAKDYITSLPDASYRYAFERQWMYYKNWGHLLYDPETPDDYFIAAFERRFPGLGQTLFSAQTRVSRVPLTIASFMNATWDYTLYSEGLLTLMDNEEMKLISLQQLCDRQPLDPDYVGVKAFLDPDREPRSGDLTPVTLADSLELLCARALQEVELLVTDGNTDLLYEVSDIRAWAQLGLYFARKLRAAVAYQEYLNEGETDVLQEAVRQMEVATEHWRELVGITSPIYDPMPLQHYERNDHASFHWSLVAAEVEAELAALRAQTGR